MSTAVPRIVDLATELGEEFALPPCGIPLASLRGQTFDGRSLHPRHLMARDDETLLDLVSTGYVACGAHSGDAIVMGNTVRLLTARNIAVGAHPSYPDILGFGQVTLALSDWELEDVVLVQIATISALAERVGGRLATVKCHGALHFDVSYDERTAQVVARTISKFDSSVSLVCLAGSPGVRVARDCGVRVFQEAYIDRGYGRDGRIVPRDHPKALVTDPAAAVQQFVDIILRQRVQAVDGAVISLAADTFCLHSDTPNSAAIAKAIVTALVAHGIGVTATA